MNKLVKIMLAIVLFAVVVAAAPMNTVQPVLLQGINRVYSPTLSRNSGTGKIFVYLLANRDIAAKLSFPNGATFRLTGRKYGSEIDGDLVQLTGPWVKDQACSATTLTCWYFRPSSIHFMMYVHDGQFQGWVDLRGEYQAFCGGAGFIPKRCLLK